MVEAILLSHVEQVLVTEAWGLMLECEVWEKSEETVGKHCREGLESNQSSPGWPATGAQ